MIIRSKLLMPALLAVCMTFAATDRVQAATDVSLQINFGSSPRWVGVPNTQIREIRHEDRAEYDVFQYGRRYYAYNHDNRRWYISRRERGRYTLISNRSVPRELRRIPRDHWRNYPTAWESSPRRDSYDSYSTLTVSFGSRPRWSGIDGTGIQMVYGPARPNYDVFRYGRTYYAYSNDRWYSSSRESGQFNLIDDRDIPREFTRVPRDRWRNYPSRWESYSDRNSRDSYATLSVSFGSTPRWSEINGTSVQMVYGSARPNYDVFRYGGSYYAYSNDRWYSSSRESGQFRLIEDRAVPSEFTRVPRDQWRNYPPAWGRRNQDNRDDGDGDGYGNGRGRGDSRDDNRENGRNGN